MIRYLDTSALVKRYVPEQGTKQVRSLMREREPLATSRLSWVESSAAFARRRREGSLSTTDDLRIREQIARDFVALAIVEPAPDVLDRAATLCTVHPLRAVDAVHLSSALWLGAHVDPEVTFVTADRALARIAGREGLQLLVPE